MAHVGQPKAVVAVAAVEQLAPSLSRGRDEGSYRGVYGSVFDMGPVELGKYSIVVNALDNIPARIHVGEMCSMAKIPVVESGSSGYLGNTQIIRPGRDECFNCVEHAPPKKIPVCSVRSTPSKPLHAIVWAKMVFGVVFGEGGTTGEGVLGSGVELEGADDDGIGAFVDSLNSVNWHAIRARGPHRLACRLYEAFFIHDVESLRSCKGVDPTQWGGRCAPVALTKWELDPPVPVPMGGGFSGRVSADSQLPLKGTERLGELVGSASPLSLKDARDLLCASCAGLLLQLHAAGEDDVTVGALEWDKDNEAAMGFVASAASLRCSVYAIDGTSPFELKGIAGNIIPAVATTNAVVSALAADGVLKLVAAGAYARLGSSSSSGPSDEEPDRDASNPSLEAVSHMWWVKHRPLDSRTGVFLSPSRLSPRNPQCEGCGPRTMSLRRPFARTSLGEVVASVCGFFAVKLPVVSYQDKVGTTKVLFEADEDDVGGNGAVWEFGPELRDQPMLSRTLEAIGLKGSAVITVANDDDAADADEGSDDTAKAPSHINVVLSDE